MSDNNLDTSKHGMLFLTFYWALMLGLIGFLGGFIGPLILRPEANQGPMLGIFITGPLGVLTGAIFGIFRSTRKNRQDPDRRA